MAYYVGIDPGKTGGIAVLDGAGQVVELARWDIKNPTNIFNILIKYHGEVNNLYLEMILAFTKGALGQTGVMVNNSATMINYGIWQGFILAAGLMPVCHLIPPLTWQAVYKLLRWQAKTKNQEPGAKSPLDLARQLYPAAALQFEADNGKGVALLLARLALYDHRHGINRTEARLERKEKTRARKKAKKAQKNPTPETPAPHPW